MDDFSVKVAKKPQYKIKITNNDSILQTSQPLSLKSTILNKVETITEIGDVAMIDSSNGAILQYNSETSKYEIKLGEFDGGEF